MKALLVILYISATGQTSISTVLLDDPGRCNQFAASISQEWTVVVEGDVKPIDARKGTMMTKCVAPMR